MRLQTETDVRSCTATTHGTSENTKRACKIALHCNADTFCLQCAMASVALRSFRTFQVCLTAADVQPRCGIKCNEQHLRSDDALYNDYSKQVQKACAAEWLAAGISHKNDVLRQAAMHRWIIIAISRYHMHLAYTGRLMLVQNTEEVNKKNVRLLL